MFKKIMLCLALAGVITIGAGYTTSSQSVASDMDIIADSIHYSQMTGQVAFSPISSRSDMDIIAD
ncbi:MAG TPA: hypothetical protein VFK33_03625 [Bacillales bacterium]|nr:hypothetical protein [Bacillales bacterium]